MNAAQVIIKTLRGLGIKRVFSTTGTDHVAFLVEDFPELVLVKHELEAISAAIGSSLKGEMGCALLHTVPGTGNSLGAIMNAFTSRIPLIIMAGIAPITEGGIGKNLRTHWTQEVKDQREIVRQITKLDMEIKDPLMAEQVLVRAYSVAMSEPRGPVYIAFSREVSLGESQIRNKKPSYYEPGPTLDKINKVKEMIEESENPIIVTWRAGRRRQWFHSLKSFAERSNIPVMNFAGEVLNYPSTGKMSIVNADLNKNDLIIVVESEVPWSPPDKVKGSVIKVDVDPLYSYLPTYGFDCTLCIQSTVSSLFDNLQVRKKDFEVKDWRKELKMEVEKLSSMSKVNPRYLSWEIGRLKPDTIYNEYVLNPVYAMPENFASYFADLSSNHLGWTLGASIGGALVSGGYSVVTMGDGAFILGVPEAFYDLAVSLSIPVTVVIYDNSGYLAVEENVEAVTDRTPLEGVKYKRFKIGETVKAFNGFYRLVEEPCEVPDALREAKRETMMGKISVVQVITQGR
ncbi:thiamine pyrophosphate-binding protein [Sulfuracidifex metallicus]|uniref:thiamine pyrophosphate-binding protein n=1 Tax=Sulfuracidifex metallicus TaxID=47303 RepID=UPI0006D10C8F|nr:thiamine pyrophosphate-binding protein [Sulfuracidifex metallicus]WOE50534.1 thiamine pyrophosphate-binding protein [Sulfuracidifex metallicus DSM 6482 = JCM 9184]